MSYVNSNGQCAAKLLIVNVAPMELFERFSALYAALYAKSESFSNNIHVSVIAKSKSGGAVHESRGEGSLVGVFKLASG